MKVIKFNAVWCSACLVMKKVYRKAQEAYPAVEWINYDYDQDADQVKQWQIGTTIPVLIFVDEQGVEMERLIGEKRYEQVVELIEKYKGK